MDYTVAGWKKIIHGMIPMPMLPMMPLQVLGLDMNALIQYKDHMQSLQDLGFTATWKVPK